MYGFKKDSKVFPVVTVVLYAGVEPWKGPTRLHEMIDFMDIPEVLKGMVSDYRIQVVDIRRLEDASVFKTDVRYVIDFLRCCEDKEALRDLVDKEPYYQNMEDDAYEIISKYSDMKGLVKVNNYKSGGVDMCKGIEGMERKCKEVVIRMLKKEMLMEDICEIAECDEVYVEQIRQEM